ncbi:MAG: hypothetical protein ACO3EZ_17110, partial [Prochlorotrichaceae cyanobacterium]
MKCTPFAFLSHPCYWRSSVGLLPLLILASHPLLAQEALPESVPEEAQNSPAAEITPDLTTPIPTESGSETEDTDSPLLAEVGTEAIVAPAVAEQMEVADLGEEVQGATEKQSTPNFPESAGEGSTDVEATDLNLDSSPSETESTAPQSILKILSPTLEEPLARPAATVVIQAPLDSIVTLQSNGVPVDPNQIGQVTTDGATGVIRQIWYGVVLQEGENLLTVTATLPDGTVQTTQQKVMLRGAVESLHVETLEAQVPADGRSTVTVRGYFLDKNGNLSNRGGRVTLSVSAGTFVGADLAPDVEGFQVDADQGEFRIELQSGVETGLVQIRAEMLGLKAETQVQFGTPQLPDGIVA